MIPSWLERLLLGRLTAGERKAWIVTLAGLLLLVPILDLAGRPHFRLNLYPLPIMLAVFLFRETGLFSLLAVFIAYGGVQVYRELGLTTIAVNNLVQLLVLGLIGLLCHMLVRSYRQLYQRESELANTRREVLMTLTHELRSPLFAAQGMIQNLMASHRKLTQDDLHSQLETASSAITAVNREVEGITQLFRVDSGRLQCRPQTLALGQVYEDLRRRHAVKGRQLVLKGEELRVEADRLLLLQALDNLVVNAFRYAARGDVTVEARALGGAEVEILVRDQGPGVDASLGEVIFERYRQGQEGTPGFGIGLYLGREYLRAQGGKLELRESEVGACFAVTVPAAQEQDSNESGATHTA